MPKHSDRRRTPQWAKAARPFGVAPGGPPDSVASLVRVPDPHCTTLLAGGPPGAITVGQSSVVNQKFVLAYF